MRELTSEEEITINHIKHNGSKCTLINDPQIGLYNQLFDGKWQPIGGGDAQYDILLYSLPNTLLSSAVLHDVLPAVHKNLRPGGLFIYVFNFGARGWFEKWLTAKVWWVKASAFFGGWIPTRFIPAQFLQWAKRAER